MEDILDKYNLSNAIDIIGDTKQVLQIALKKNTSIIINKTYLSYASSYEFEEKPYHEDPININSTSTNRIKSNELIRLRNIKDSLEYLGLTNQSKIIKITPMLYNNLFIRLTSFLAFSDTINLIEDSTVQETLTSLFRRIPKNKIFIYPSFCLIQSPNLALLSNRDISLNSLMLLREVAYLTCNGSVIEKRLGENESIGININGLIAFEQSISFSSISSPPNNINTNKYISYLSRIEDVIVSGPGLVIFEIIHKAPIINKMSLLMIIGINIFILICFSIGQTLA